MSNPSENPDQAPESKPVLDYHTPGRDAKGWVLVWTARNGAEANLAVTALQAQGLHARTDSENTATLGAWAGAGPGTSTNVQVIEDDVEAARAILADIDAERQRRQRADELACPRCGEVGAVRIMPPGRWIGLTLFAIAVATSSLNAQLCFPIFGLGVALLLWPMMPKWRCGKCGNRWRAPAPKEIDEEE